MCDAALRDLSLVSESLLRGVGERVKDKRATIARDAITGLVQVYRAWTYDVENDEDESQGEDEGELRTEMQKLGKRRKDEEWQKKLSWIPGTMFMCISRKEDVVRDRVFQLFDDILLPRSSSVLKRTASLIQVYENLSAREMQGFEMMLKKRAMLQTRLRKYLHARNHTEASAGNDLDSLSILRSLATQTAEQMNRKLQLKVTKELHTKKNKRVFKLLELFANPSTSIAVLRKSRTTLLSTVGSKSELADFLRFLLRKISTLSLNADSMSHLLELVDSESAKNLLRKVSVHAPGMFEGAMSSLELHLKNSLEKFVRCTSSSSELKDKSFELTEVLKLICRLDLKRISESKNKEAQHSIGDIREHLINICKSLTKDYVGKTKKNKKNKSQGDFTSTHCKFASRALLNDDNVDEDDLMNVLDRIKLSLDIDDERLPCALRVVGEFVTSRPSFFDEDEMKQIWTLVVGKNGILSEENKDVTGEDASSVKEASLDTRVLALKVLTKIGKLHDSKEKSLEILSLILNGLDSENTSSSPFSKPQKDFDLTGLQDLSNDEDSNLRAALRITAAKCVLRLAKNYAFSIDVYHRLAWVLLDSNDEVRNEVLDAVIKRLSRNEVPPLMYMAMMIMTANDPIASIRERSKSRLLYFVRTRHRETKAWLASRRETEDEDETTRAMSVTMAEYMIPYAIHLIAHVPTFQDHPMSEYFLKEGSARHNAEKSSIQKYLKASLTPLLKTSDSGVDLVFEILDRICKSVDVFESENSNTQLLAEMAQKILFDEYNFDPLDRRTRGRSVILPVTMYISSSEDDGRSSTGSFRSSSTKKRPSPLRRDQEENQRRVKPRKEDEDSENLTSQNRVENETTTEMKKRRSDVMEIDQEDEEETKEEEKSSMKKFTTGFGKIDSSNILSGSRRSRMR